MESNKIEAQEAVEERKNIEEREAKINKYKTQIADKSDMFAKLSVPYDDLNILFDKTQELELVNYFFDSISCRR